MVDIEQEKLIVKRAKEDLEAFGELYDIYFKKIYSFVMYMVKNHADTEDIVSRTFEKAMLNIDKFEYRGYTFGAWLYRIARNLVYDRSKKKKTASFEDVEMFIDTSEYSPEKLASRDEMNNYLKELLNHLNESQLEIVYLRYIKGYSIKQVCNMTERTEDSVKSLAKRAMAKLSKIAEEEKNE